MKKVLLFLAIISFLNADITIKDAWQKVLHVNEGLKASKAEVDEAKKLQKATDYLYLPEISVSGSYTRMEKELAIEDEIDLSGLGIPKSIPLHLPLQDQDMMRLKQSTI